MKNEYVSKNVILCRSGIQIYSNNEIKAQLDFIDGNAPEILDKDYYRVMRPVGVVAKAQGLCKTIPLTKEHPPKGWLYNDEDIKEHIQGTTGSDVGIEAIDNDIIGIKADLKFFTKEIYEYYLENKEVSLGYTSKQKWVENPNELGYDIEMTEISVVNHLALTKAGRGGKDVAVIDSIKKENINIMKNTEDKDKVVDTQIQNDSEKDKETENKKQTDDGCGKDDKTNDEKGKENNKDGENEKKKNDSANEKEDKDKGKDDEKDGKTNDSVIVNDSEKERFRKEIKDMVLNELKWQLVDEIKKELDVDKAKDDILSELKKFLGVSKNKVNDSEGVVVDSIVNQASSIDYSEDVLNSMWGR